MANPPIVGSMLEKIQACYTEHSDVLNIVLDECITTIKQATPDTRYAILDWLISYTSPSAYPPDWKVFPGEMLVMASYDELTNKPRLMVCTAIEFILDNLDAFEAAAEDYDPNTFSLAE